VGDVPRLSHNLRDPAYKKALSAARGEITDDEAAKLADKLSLEVGVEDALLAAEATARSAGLVELGEVLARVHMLWSIGGIRYARALLDRARDSALEALKETTDS